MKFESLSTDHRKIFIQNNLPHPYYILAIAVYFDGCCLSVMQFKAQVYVKVVVLLLLMLKLEGIIVESS